MFKHLYGKQPLRCLDKLPLGTPPLACHCHPIATLACQGKMGQNGPIFAGKKVKHWVHLLVHHQHEVKNFSGCHNSAIWSWISRIHIESCPVWFAYFWAPNSYKTFKGNRSILRWRVVYENHLEIPFWFMAAKRHHLDRKTLDCWINYCKYLWNHQHPWRALAF